MLNKAQWIWKVGDRRPINEHVCFRKTFEWSGDCCGATISISADTRYRLFVNGQEVGGGPIRSTVDHWYYDTYDVRHLVRTGHNTIAVHVWHYGHSNYQYVEAEAGLIAQLDLIDDTGKVESIITDSSWLEKTHDAYEKFVVKRNVNLGWMEIYDANRQEEEWILPEYKEDATWSSVRSVADYGQGPWGQLNPRDIEWMSTQTLLPKQVIQISEVMPPQQVLSINMRTNFFPEARHANANIFSGFLATTLKTDVPLKGKLTFAHSPWNGVQGRFKIGQTWYKHDEEITIEAGEHLFLLEISGVHNDLLTHLELAFDQPFTFVHPFGGSGVHKVGGRQKLSSQDAGASFITIGPLEVIKPVADGRSPVYGGVEKSTGLNPELPLFLEIGACDTTDQLAAYREQSKDVAPEYMLVDQMIYSLMLRQTTLQKYPITRESEKMIFGHAQPTILPTPQQGGDIETVLDFGKIYVGTIEFEIEAPKGTIVDVYGFENRYNGVTSFTSGCNNSFRYICRGGRQTFKSISRMGFRYLIMTLRHADDSLIESNELVKVVQIKLHQTSYPATDQAMFRCSDPLLNDIWEISRHTAHMCVEDTFTDCPTYEQVFWVGDSRVSSLIANQLFGSSDLVRHCLEMVPRSRSESPLLLALMPTDWQAAIPMWTFSWVIACREYIEYSGDMDFAARIYPEIVETLKTYRTFLNEQDLFDTSTWNMLDWAPIDLPYVGVVTAQQALLAFCHDIAGEMATSLGYTSESAQLHSDRDRLKKAIKTHLQDEKGEYVDGMHRDGAVSTTRSLQTHILLYLTDCLDEEGEDRDIVTKLLQPPAEWIEIGTPFFSFYLFEAWQRLDQLPRIVERIRTDWGKMIRYGATTTWESFQVFPRSHAHAWSAAPAFVMGGKLLGIERTADGYRKVRISPPDPKVGIDWAEGSVPTPLGRIDVLWSAEKEQKTMQVKVPASIEIEIDPSKRADWDIQVITI